jgi:aspartyl-tRNA(Asn)/glutamyl-tRNA(Gln) amidotransferase subunit B
MNYEVVIGLEVHAHLDTASKLFCGCANAFGDEPNTRTCPVCLGMPGVLPVVNRTAFEYALRTALAFHCTVAPVTRFDRKNYYYPDLPKNYQISQNYVPLGRDGWIEIVLGDATRRAGIDNVHLEEDAGKNMHSESTVPGEAPYTLVDLNRAGVPLLEIVSRPDLRSVAEADAYMRTVRQTLIYLGVSACRMERGQLRFEASVSLRPHGQAALGNRVEIKNLNSMKAVNDSLTYEIERQTKALDAGETVERETRLWDEPSGRSQRMRSKELAHDYRYFPEPDLVPVAVDESMLARARAAVPELPAERWRRYVDALGLPPYDAGVLTADHQVADYFEAVLRRVPAEPKQASNFVMGEVLRELNDRRLAVADFPVPPEDVGELIRLVKTGAISITAARETVFPAMVAERKPPRTVIAEKGLAQVSDTGELGRLVDQVLAAHPGAVTDFRAGKSEVLRFIVGQVMRLSKGQANPQVVHQLLRERLA